MVVCGVWLCVWCVAVCCVFCGVLLCCCVLLCVVVCCCVFLCVLVCCCVCVVWLCVVCVVWLCVVVCGCVWLCVMSVVVCWCVVMCGCVWCVVVCGCVWLCVVVCGCVCISSSLVLEMLPSVRSKRSRVYFQNARVTSDTDVFEGTHERVLNVNTREYPPLFSCLSLSFFISLISLLNAMCDVCVLCVVVVGCACGCGCGCVFVCARSLPSWPEKRSRVLCQNAPWCTFKAPV